jgi:hypothetical protein
MGQQQLLLLILGTLIVGIAIAVGFGMFSSGSITVNRDAMVNDMNIIASTAQQHYVRPIVMGGGGGSFDGYSLPHRLNITGNGIYRAEAGSNELTIMGSSVLHNDVVIRLTITMADDGWNYNWDWEHEGL